MLIVPIMSNEPNQGEGDRSSASRYDEHLREFVARGKVSRAADLARSYIARHPDDAARAERRARRGPHPAVDLDALIAKGRTLIERIRRAVRRVRGA